jgi:putative ABC transport system permease protein
LRSWLTLLGIFIGIVAVVSLISLGDALKIAVNSQFGISSTQVITVQAGGLTGYGPPGTGVVNPLKESDAEAIEKISSVRLAAGRSIETVKVEFNDRFNYIIAASIPGGVKRDALYEIQELEAEAGRLLDDSDFSNVIVGNNFKTKEKSGFDKAVEVGNKIKISDKDFKVVGILEKKGSFILDNTIFMNEDALNDIADINDTFDVIAVIVKEKELMNTAKEEIEKVMRDRRGVKKGEEDFTVSTPQALLETVNSILDGVQTFVVIIALISIIVGAIGIINTMTTSVLERVREIGIMKAIGAKNQDIFYQFFIEAGFLGLIGGSAGIMIGVIIGFIGTFVINNLLGSTIAPNINFSLIFFSLAGSFLIGSTAGIIPAMNAARLNPVDALRS